MTRKFCVALAFAIAAFGFTGGSSHAATQHLTAGWYTGDSVHYRTGNVNALPRKPRVVNYYANWGSVLDGTAYDRAFVHAAAVDGVTTFIELEPWDGPGTRLPARDRLAAIAGGSSDAALRAFGARIAAQNTPVWVTFGHEQNGGAWYPWNLHGIEHATPATWIRAWNRVTSEVDAGAGKHRSLISWAWAPNVATTTAASLSAVRAYYHSGSQAVRNVNILGLDAFLCHGLRSGTCTETYRTSIAPTVHAIRGLNPRLPLVITETGIGGTPGTRTPQVTALVRAARGDGIAGALWFNDGPYTMTSAEQAAWAKSMAGG